MPPPAVVPSTAGTQHILQKVHGRKTAYINQIRNGLAGRASSNLLLVQCCLRAPSRLLPLAAPPRCIQQAGRCPQPPRRSTPAAQLQRRTPTPAAHRKRQIITKQALEHIRGKRHSSPGLARAVCAVALSQARSSTATVHTFPPTLFCGHKSHAWTSCDACAPMLSQQSATSTVHAALHATAPHEARYARGKEPSSPPRSGCGAPHQPNQAQRPPPPPPTTRNVSYPIRAGSRCRPRRRPAPCSRTRGSAPAGGPRGRTPAGWRA